jgi:hypothetical protein
MERPRVKSLGRPRLTIARRKRASMSLGMEVSTETQQMAFTLGKRQQ